MAPTQNLSQPTLRVFVGTLLLGALVGLISGLYPAWRAGRLQPAEALKNE